MTAQCPPRVYIAYKWQDPARNRWVNKLYVDLRTKHGIDAILDTYEVAYGESFGDYMTEQISRCCDALLLVITPKAVEAIDWLKKGALHFETQLALTRKLEEPEFRFIPVLRAGNELTAYVKPYRYIDFRDDDEYDEQLKRLAASLWGDDGRPPLAPPPKRIETPGQT